MLCRTAVRIMQELPFGVTSVDMISQLLNPMILLALPARRTQDACIAVFAVMRLDEIPDRESKSFLQS